MRSIRKPHKPKAFLDITHSHLELHEKSLREGATLENWRLLNLGRVEPFRAQTFYEAVACAVDEALSPNTVILCQPAEPYVCVGYHQDLESEIDTEYCRKHNLPIIRRSQGGGATYLDSNQIFYQIVASHESQVIPYEVEKLFERLLSVTVYACRKLGLPAEFKALNDVIVNGRKISGNGAGQFGEHNITILVGNIILDLNYDSMARVLKVPTEKFRDKMAQSMREWVTSLKRELNHVPPVDQIERLLVDGYKNLLEITLDPSDPSAIEERIWKEQIKPKHVSYDWLHIQERRRDRLMEGRAVRIADGVKVVQVDHKARKLIRIRSTLIGDRISDVVFSGDFFVIPEDELGNLEVSLKGVTLDREEVLERVKKFYKERRIQTPGIFPNDFVEGLMKLRELAETYPPSIYPHTTVGCESTKKSRDSKE